MKKIISTDSAPKAIGPYSQAVLMDSFLFCSGQIPIDPKTNEVFTGDIKTQTEMVIKNIEGFPNSVVQVFSRYGSSVFYSVNYPIPWDGRFKGADLPVGTYYYIIDLKNGSKPTTGWLAIVR